MNSIATFKHRLIAVVQDRSFYFYYTKPKTADEYLKRLTTFEGLHDEEIRIMEGHYGNHFPEAFRAYLSCMGKQAGSLFRDTAVATCLRGGLEFRAKAEKLIKDVGIENFLRKKDFIFQVDRESAFYYIEVAGDHDGSIYFYQRGDNGPQKAAASFEEYLDEAIRVLEQDHKESKNNGGYFVTVNENGKVIPHRYSIRYSNRRSVADIGDIFL